MIKELRTKTDLELGELIAKLKMQLLETRFKMANGEIEGVHKRKEIRKTIAQAMTILSERNVKISFTSLDTQVIKEKDGKQEIKTIAKFKRATSSKKTTKKETDKTPTKKSTSAKSTDVKKG